MELFYFLLLLSVVALATASSSSPECEVVEDVDCRDLKESVGKSGYSRFVSPHECNFGSEEEEGEETVRIVLQLTKIHRLDADKRVGGLEHNQLSIQWQTRNM